MFELAIFSAFCLIVAALALVTIYQRRQDVLYGPYIEDVSWPPARHDERVEAPS
jgi:hypothetical protein